MPFLDRISARPRAVVEPQAKRGPLAEALPYICHDRSGRFLLGASYGGNLVSVNAIALGRRSRTRDAIGAVRHVFLDADHDGPAVLSRVEARRDLPSPSYILHSSPNHIHVFWRVSGFDPDAVERLQKQLTK